MYLDNKINVYTILQPVGNGRLFIGLPFVQHAKQFEGLLPGKH